MENAFYTCCRKCRKQILMVRNLRGGYWTACDPYIIRFKEGNSERFIDADGDHRNGTRSTAGEIGYKEHRRTCA